MRFGSFGGTTLRTDAVGSGAPPPDPPSGTLPARIAAIRSGAGPNWWSRLNHLTLVIDEIGALDGTVVNMSDVGFLVGSLVTDGDGDSSMAFQGTPNVAGGFSISPPFQSAVFSVSFRLQVDVQSSIYTLLTIGGGDNIDGESILKLVTDGGTGMRPQFETRGPVDYCIKVANPPASIPIGRSTHITFVRTASDMRVWVDGVELAMSVVSGTLATWGATPNAAWHFCYFTSSGGQLITGFNGLMADVIVCDTAMSESDITSLALNASDLVAARTVSMGNIDENAAGVLTASTLSRIHPETGATLSIVSQPAVGVAAVSGVSLTLDPAPVSGDTPVSFTYRTTHANGTDTGTANATIEEAGSGTVPDLPFFGQYYGSVIGGRVGDTSLELNTDLGVHAFFYADRTGTVTQLMWYKRYGTNYSLGSGGIYTLEIRPANPSTRVPIAGSAAICRLTGHVPGNPAGNADLFYGPLNFSLTGQLVAKQPYALVVRNTHTSPPGNHVSQNTPVIYAFNDDSNPSNYAEPGDGVSGSVNPQSVGASVAPVRGWDPVRIDGVTTYNPYPTIGENGVLRYRRLGPPMLFELIYSDGRVTTGGAYGAEDNISYNIQIAGATQVRERFRVTRATRTVSGVFIRVSKRVAANDLVVTLESGPSSDTLGNGTIMESVTVPHSNFLLVDNHFSQERWCEACGYTAPFFKVHWVWVPFSPNQTLTLGSIYNLRLAASGSFDGRIFTNNRKEARGLSPVSTSWTAYETERLIAMNAWEDSRGCQQSTNSGGNWAFVGGNSRKQAPILFKCV